MSDSMTRIVDAMALSALVTVEWHKDRRPYRLSRAVAWERRQRAYNFASGINCQHMAERAKALAIASSRRALAWRALAAMDAREAAAHRTQAHKARAMCAALTQGVWRA